MFEGAFVDNIMLHSETRAYPVEPQITSGLVDGTQGFYRYALRESTYPILSIVDKIQDKFGNTIEPGHYELCLSDEKDLLILVQSKKAIAIIPVFKVEIDMSHQQQVHDKKSLKRAEKEEQEIAKTNRKRERKGMPAVNNDKDIYQEASVEYVEDGDYYLIRYERDDVKAWGAIKAE